MISINRLVSHFLSTLWSYSLTVLQWNYSPLLAIASLLNTLYSYNTQYSILFYLSRSFEFLCQLVYLPILVSHYLPKVLLACLLVFFWVHSVMIFTNLQSGICLSWKAHLKRCYLQNLIRSHDQ